MPDLLTRAYENIDENLQKLGGDLNPPQGSKDKKIGDRFERAVMTLFSLLGLPSVHIGEDGDLVAADVLCRAASGDLLLVECSIRAVGPDKRAKLQGRARDLEGKLAGRGSPVRVIPVAVQADPSGKDDPEWVLDRAALKSLLECVMNGVAPGRLASVMSPRPASPR